LDNGIGGRGLRLFSLTPISTFKQKFILIDTDVLHDLMTSHDIGIQVPNRETFRENALEWWRTAFDVDKLTTATKRFGFSISTDGVQYHQHNLKQFLRSNINDWGYDFDGEFHEMELQPETRVVAMDPGRGSLYVAASGNTPDDIQECKTKRWREISGATYAAAKNKTWMAADRHWQQMVTLIPTPCCYTTEEYRLHLTHVLELRDELLGFYRETKWRRLRWKTRIKRQKAYDTLYKELAGDAQDVVIAYGGGKFSPNSRGHPPTPNKHLFLELKRRTRARLVPEFRTSKMCSLCDHELVQSRFWSIKSCNNNNCWTRWNRDVNAARNIMRVFLHMNANGGYRPEAFRRGNPHGN
jgi:hypothetical protein